MAACHWIANVASVAGAQWRMINNLALGIVATSSGTRIHAFAIYTGPIRRTFAVQNAFWAAFDVRITEIFWYTRTSSSTIVLLTNGICSAWCWLTRMRRFSFSFTTRQKKKTKIWNKNRTEQTDWSGNFLRKMSRWQPPNGSPVNPFRQLQCGRW